MRAQEVPDVFLEKSACHGVLMATKALLWSSCDVQTRSYGVLVGDCALMACTLCALHFHDVRTALSRRSHCAFIAFALR